MALGKYLLRPANVIATAEENKVVLEYDMNLYQKGGLGAKDRFISCKHFRKEFEVEINADNELDVDTLIAMFELDHAGFGFVDMDVKIYDEDYNKLVWRHYCDYTMYHEAYKDLYMDLPFVNSKEGELLLAKDEGRK